MEPSRGPLEWDPALPPGQHTSVSIDQLYKHMISSNRPITPFMSTDEFNR